MPDASSVAYCDSDCAMNSVSRVACIKAASEKEERARKAASSDEQICVTRCVNTVAKSLEDALETCTLVAGDTVEGMVVEISVWTSTMVSIVL